MRCGKKVISAQLPHDPALLLPPWTEDDEAPPCFAVRFDNPVAYLELRRGEVVLETLVRHSSPMSLAAIDSSSAHYC